jgi:hypothetical protein
MGEAKIAAATARHLADPDALARMRARLDANRMTGAKMSEAIASARGWRPRRHLFASNAELEDWIVAQYRAGSSARAIGRQLEMAVNAISRQLRARGIALPGRGKKQRRLARSAAIPGRRGLRHRCLRPRDRHPLCRGPQRVGARPVYGVGQQAVRTALYCSGVIPRGKGARPSKISFQERGAVPG